jgi:hypothetical protein
VWGLPRAAPGCRGGGVVVDLISGAGLHDFAQVHDGDAVADVLDDGEVVGDEEVGEREFLLELFEEVDDLCLDRDVEGGDGFVEDEELRIQGERSGDADALALTTGELVGEAAAEFAAEADELEKFVDSLAPVLGPVDRRR